MFNSLSEKLESAFKNLRGEARINDLNIANTVKDIRRALIDADVNFKIAKEFTDKVKEKAVGEKVINAISPGQLMVKIVKDELAELMGGTEAQFNITGNPAIILIAGLQGSGKTTFTGKLAHYLKTKKGKSWKSNWFLRIFFSSFLASASSYCAWAFSTSVVISPMPRIRCAILSG